MKNSLRLLIVFSLFFSKVLAQDSKLVSECTVLYDVSIEDAKADHSIAKQMVGTSKTVFIKGTKTRSDLETPNFKQTMIYDSKNDSTIILRELGNTKYISFLDGNKRKEKNKKYEGIIFNKTSDKKTILGYDCNKVIAQLANGSSFDVFYTTSIIPSNTGYEYQFKDLPGFVLEYEGQLENGNVKVKYSASKITLLPVPFAKFDLPKIGFRIL